MTEPWEHIHRAADAERPALKRAVLEALNGYRVDLDMDALRGLLGQSAGFREIWALFESARARVRENFEAAAKRSIDKATKAGYRAEARVSARRFVEGFDLVNPEMVAFIERYSLSLVTGIDDVTREALRALLLRAANGELTVDRLAKLIREAVGLTSAQTVAMQNVEADAFARAIKEGKSIARAQEIAGIASERYRNRAIRERAESIARTETMRAANAGQQMLWDQHIRDGLLPASAMKIWIITPDDRLCPRCRALRDLEAPVTEPFQTPEGEVEHPPLHPRCRCAMGISRL